MTHKYLLLLWITACLLTGCLHPSSLKDPFGAYAVQEAIADRNAQAVETVAQYDRDARIIEAEKRAWASVDRARSWANILPTIVLMICLCVVGVVYIHWNGQITLARVQSGELPQPRPRSQVSDAHLEELKTIAAQRNQQFKVVNGIALLIDKKTGAIVKQRPL